MWYNIDPESMRLLSKAIKSNENNTSMMLHDDLQDPSGKENDVKTSNAGFVHWTYPGALARGTLNIYIYIYTYIDQARAARAQWLTGLRILQTCIRELYYGFILRDYFMERYYGIILRDCIMELLYGIMLQNDSTGLYYGIISQVILWDYIKEMCYGITLRNHSKGLYYGII